METAINQMTTQDKCGPFDHEAGSIMGFPSLQTWSTVFVIRVSNTDDPK